MIMCLCVAAQAKEDASLVPRGASDSLLFTEAQEAINGRAAMLVRGTR